MIYICPQCTFHTLFEKMHIELPPDMSNDEFTVMALECSSCHSYFLGEQSERHHPVESLDSFAYRIEGADSFSRLLSLLNGCTESTDKNDSCETHQKLLAANTKNNWQQMDWKKFQIEINEEKVYPLEVSLDIGIPEYLPV